ncbi:hypothetical protein SHI21_18150 [Bacteriovorax sp. PP10]|uniref:Transporter n=1 Tax=Bacteriovorax antarcticus TaxID=3088717 RepID=A0ABU5VYM9_9BACT|nr:hypothetical protein [Bacteriovorax sp. PP10]MEA9358162.1 hypothetical protein [Bacteriovorax sp. PP10]
MKGFFTLILFLCGLQLLHAKDLTDIDVSVSFYSETIYDSRISGAVNESRLRLIPELDYKWLRPYAGVTFSKDLSNGKAPILTENMIAPTAGLQVKALPFLYFFGEARRLYRINNEKRNDSEKELRYGAFAYHYLDLPKNMFNEFYGEIIVVDRVDTKPVTVLWNKLGFRYLPYAWLRPDVYLEGFTRMSPNPGYGPDENELRLGSRLTFLKGFWAAGVSMTYAPVSNVKKGGIDSLLVISREVF